MSGLEWQRYPLVNESPLAKAWLNYKYNMGRSSNTIDAYGRGLDDFLRFISSINVELEKVTREHIALYIHNLDSRPNPRVGKQKRSIKTVGLSNATIQQRLTIVRTFFEHLVEDGLKKNNPVASGRFAKNNPSGGKRGLVPRYEKLPWIPTEEQWHRLIQVLKKESERTKFMFALSYDAALRREELCLLRIEDFDPAHRVIKVRAENTKNRRERVVPFTKETSLLFMSYLTKRKQLSSSRDFIFLSESNRNKAAPISKWAWSKIVQRIAIEANVPEFSPHTLRHLCLTDLARAEWDIHQIAEFAGHKNPETTLRYIHLSGHELLAKFEDHTNQIHAIRSQSLANIFQINPNDTK